MSNLTPDEAASVSQAMDKASSAPSTTGAATQTASSNLQSSPSDEQRTILDEALTAVNLSPHDFERLRDLKVEVEVFFGTAKLPLKQILEFRQGTLITLDRLAGEPVDIKANGKLIAKGEVVVVDENFGVKILEILGSNQQISLAKQFQGNSTK